MVKIYVLDHQRKFNGYTDTKLIGLYISLQLAEEAKKRSLQLRGFIDFPDDFSIDEIVMDVHQYPNGFHYPEDDEIS